MECRKSIKNNGFTLIELVVVIAILGILAGISIPRLSGFRDKAEEVVCTSNMNQLEKYYVNYLDSNDLDHNDSHFEMAKSELFGNTRLCPRKGIINWNGDGVMCSIHSNQDNSDDDEGGGEEVPYL